MRKIVVVGSSINPRKGAFTYSPVRTVVSSEERFRQTIFTINSLRTSLPDSKIVIVDSSDNYVEYKSIIDSLFIPNVEFVPLKELSGDAFEFVNSNVNKSACESVLLNTYYKQYKKQILEYDILIKATGRYFYFGLTDSSFHNDEIYFKSPLKFEWNDSWKYRFVDRRECQNNNKLHQYCTILYAFGTKHLDKFIDMNSAAEHLMNQKCMEHYDIETLTYYFTRSYENIITETNWIVSGWDGVSGRFMYY